ncbi:Rossmann-like and DUF2520 domain-containing protein [Flavobacterium stagni]|uniref:DUF2520 domain-containing protein n=1 Tax=Flavobacterium stagni TaxID=2506421 RepID=A0A4Q1K7H1_9FLAO|nr:F420-dependent NADP oxidoreductase [Flavobacterium stagni]RXR21437.1 DUF2520 domain-containing protein [Flavobacterium stagni]
MIKTVIIGSGNVAQHLITAFRESGNVHLVQVLARHPKTLEQQFPDLDIITDAASLAEADVYVIAVSDNAIGAVSSQLPLNNKLVVHTSGTTSLAVLDPKNRRGVFYPLQTFTKGKRLAYHHIPFCLETEHESDYAILHELAHSVSESVYRISEDQRKALHVAAVFVCNFTNHLYQIGHDLCEEHQVPFAILQPLIAETADKIQTLTPQQAQTGPALRGDTETLNRHLAALTDATQKEVYQLLTKSIIDHGKKL